MKGDVMLHVISMIVVLLFAFYEAVYVVLNRYTSIPFKVVAVIVIAAVVNLAVRRKTYLPFLGKMAIPKTLLKEPSNVKAGDVTVNVDVNMPDDTRVIYWASKSSKKVIENPADAYDTYENVGVAVVKNKKATFYVACPSSYNVPPMRTLRPHVHYRVVLSNGLLGEVKTVKVDC